jgi:dTDP-4-dehydrorhamnose reductase
MKILLTGRHGQVGYELERSLQHLGEVISTDRKQLNLGDPDQIRNLIREKRPTIIVNAAAYTAVDRAESEPDVAMQINGIAPGIMAEEAARIGATMVHYSTDYVFDGKKEGEYVEEDVPSPINVYGKTKLIGEQNIQSADIPFLILRTSWVYGMHGNNFMKTMLRLAKERDELRVVADQYGTPTWSRTIAEVTAFILALCRNSKEAYARMEEISGIYHLNSNGSTTWCDFAKAILKNADSSARVIPITTEEYPVAAARPKNSRMSNNFLTKRFCNLPDWENALSLCQTQ